MAAAIQAIRRKKRAAREARKAEKTAAEAEAAEAVISLDVQEAFHKYDSDGSCSISKNELGAAFRTLGLKASTDQLEQIKHLSQSVKKPDQY